MADRVTLREPIDLIPVLELEPSVFARPERASPGAGATPEIFHEHWKSSLEDAGIVGLEPVEIGSWFVPLTGVPAPVLGILADRWLAENGEDVAAAIEGTCGWKGGAILRSAGRSVVTPTCCASLGDVDEWAQAARYRGAEWSMLWIGHPWISMRFEDEHLVLSEPHESGAPVEQCRVRPSALEAAHERAVAILEDLARRLEAVLRERLPAALASELARRLAGIGE